MLGNNEPLCKRPAVVPNNSTSGATIVVESFCVRWIQRYNYVSGLRALVKSAKPDRCVEDVQPYDERDDRYDLL